MTTTPNFTWTDAHSRKWSACISFDDAVRLRERASIDLLDPRSMETLFSSNPLQRVEAMAELARRQWETAGLQYTEFTDALLSTQNSFTDATAALRSAISDFSRRLGRNDLAIVSDRAWESMDMESKIREQKASGEKVTQILQAALARGERQIDDALDKALATLGNTSGSSPGSLDSTGGY